MLKRIFQYKKLSNILLLILLAATITSVISVASDHAPSIDTTGIVTINKDRYLLQSGKISFVLSMLPSAGRDSCGFHPADGDTLRVKGIINQYSIRVFEAFWKGKQYTFWDRFGKPVWKGNTTHKIDTSKCIGIECGLCTLYCPNCIIFFNKTDNGLKAIIDQTKCSGCNACIAGNNVNFNGCPYKAISK